MVSMMWNGGVDPDGVLRKSVAVGLCRCVPRQLTCLIGLGSLIISRYPGHLSFHQKMSKRSATDIHNQPAYGQAYTKAPISSAKRDDPTVDEMGEFEDAWEDEIESDEDAVDREASRGEDGTRNSADDLIFITFVTLSF